MQRAIRHFAIIAGLALTLAGPARAGPDSERERMYASIGAAQEAYFTKRLNQLAKTIFARERSGALPHGPASLMRQDLERVWIEMNRILDLNGRLRPQQYASCAMMLSKVDRRLASVDLQRRPTQNLLPVSRQTAIPASRAAF